MNRIYLDYNSTTPVSKEVFDEMLPYFCEKFGNPSSSHGFGQKVMHATDNARMQIAKFIGANPDEIIFTGSGTESNNLAIIGTAHKNREKKNHIITSMIEHSSVFNTCKYLESTGYDVTYLPVNKEGMISPEDVKSAITKKTVLISLMLANNETGTIQKIKKVSEIAEENRVFLHSDAIQAAGKLKLDVNSLGVDMLSISGHKIYGPKGIGALYLRRGISITPLIYGGGQEKKIRSGTENVPGIVGLGKACEIANSDFNKRNKHLAEIRDALENGLLKNIPQAKVNGSINNRIANTTNISFAGEENESLLVRLDLNGIAVSAGSACSTSSSEVSRPLKAMGLSTRELYSSLRFSVGLNTTLDDIEYTVDVFKKLVK
ncbi:MAG TPA: cysteine desulfurase family protein [Victivallales bacterium]|nr:cysteine desulfurase family protein [Victivallales bacterium]